MWWKLLASAVVLALAAFLVTQYGKARFNAGELAERVKWKDEELDHAQVIADLRVDNERRVGLAITNYAERLAEREPIILRSKETVTRYAQTDAGRVLCLAIDRLRGIDGTRSELFPTYAIPAPAGTESLPSDPDPDQ